MTDKQFTSDLFLHTSDALNLISTVVGFFPSLCFDVLHPAQVTESEFGSLAPCRVNPAGFSKRKEHCSHVDAAH